MDKQLCIHCAQKPPCPYQDGIFCKVTPCYRDNPGKSNPFAGNADFMKTFGDMFGGGFNPGSYRK